MKFLEIFGMTILAMAASVVIILVGITFLIMCWPFVLVALIVSIIIYFVYLIHVAKPDKKRKRNG